MRLGWTDRSVHIEQKDGELCSKPLLYISDYICCISGTRAVEEEVAAACRVCPPGWPPDDQNEELVLTSGAAEFDNSDFGKGPLNLRLLLDTRVSCT